MPGRRPIARSPGPLGRSQARGLLARLALLALLALLGLGSEGCGGEDGGGESLGRTDPKLLFVPLLDAELEGAGPLIELEAQSPGGARAELFDALGRIEGRVALRGGEGWETVVAQRPGQLRSEAISRGRLFVRSRGSGLRLDFRLGAGDRFALMGGAVTLNAEQGLAQVRAEDPLALGARYRIRFFRDEGPGRGRIREITPSYLRRPLGRGRYRSRIEIPPRGARFLASVTIRDRRGELLALGWASPITVERPRP